MRHVEHVMGTVFSIDAPGATDLGGVVEWLHRVDGLFSTYRPESELSRLARGELALVACDPLVAEVLALCEEAEARSDGWFSPRYAGGLDPTGLVKGWAVEAAGQLLDAAGVPDWCVNGGGDVQLRGSRPGGAPWRTGVADPLRPGRLAVVVEGAGTGRLGVATSGTAERGCHVLDPHTGAPANGGLASVTVLAEGLAAADAWATAAFAMGEGARDWLQGLPGVEAFAVTADGGTWRTDGFAALAGPLPRTRG